MPQPAVLRPFDLAGHALRNRAAVAPMTRVSAGADGWPTPAMADAYAQYAEGGFGLVITEGTWIDRAFSMGYRNQPGLVDDRQEAGWRRVVDRVQAAGAAIVLQLMHAGALVQHNAFRDETIAPSAVRPRGEQLGLYGGAGPYPVPVAMSRSSIRAVVNAFASAARRAVSAGFDGVEIHGANGYLLHQFLDGRTNRREDGYGGSLANRLRIYQEVVEAVREAVGPATIVGLRVSQTAVNDRDARWPGRAAAEEIFTTLSRLPINYVHTTGGPARAPAFEGGDASLADLAARFTARPVIANGGLDELREADAVITSGAADLVSIGRGAIACPDWPARVAGGLDPVAFDPAMLRPTPTLESVERWRAEHDQAALCPTS